MVKREATSMHIRAAPSASLTSITSLRHTPIHKRIRLLLCVLCVCVYVANSIDAPLSGGRDQTRVRALQCDQREFVRADGTMKDSWNNNKVVIITKQLCVWRGRGVVCARVSCRVLYIIYGAFSHC